MGPTFVVSSVWFFVGSLRYSARSIALLLILASASKFVVHERRGLPTRRPASCQLNKRHWQHCPGSDAMQAATCVYCTAFQGARLHARFSTNLPNTRIPYVHNCRLRVCAAILCVIAHSQAPFKLQGRDWCLRRLKFSEARPRVLRRPVACQCPFGGRENT